MWIFYMQTNRFSTTELLGKHPKINLKMSIGENDDEGTLILSVKSTFCWLKHSARRFRFNTFFYIALYVIIMT